MLPLPVFNAQPAEKPDRRADGSLDVHSVFLTIQGEGPLAGTPAVFVRLAGCSLQCRACDTLYTSGRRRLSIAALLDEVDTAADGSFANLIVITGGEPLRQNLAPFAYLACDDGNEVQVETNGVHADPGLASLVKARRLSIVCSPKTPAVPRALAEYVTAWKYVLAAGEVDPKDGLPLTVLGEPLRPARPSGPNKNAVFVQPQDDKDPARNAANARAAVESCLRFGYRLSVQTHKYLGLE